LAYALKVSGPAKINRFPDRWAITNPVNMRPVMAISILAPTDELKRRSQSFMTSPDK
jgi:hypothetical protein